MIITNKKGVTEIVSYLLLTFLVVIISSITYFFAQDYITSIQQEQDFEHMEVHLKKISLLMNGITSFDGDASTYFLSFTQGQLELRGSELIYASKVPYSGSSTCLTHLCYESRNGFEIIILNLPEDYTFTQNTRILPGSHFIHFEHYKEGEKVHVSLK